jgi:hypothetical protein
MLQSMAAACKWLLVMLAAVQADIKLIGLLPAIDSVTLRL